VGIREVARQCLDILYSEEWHNAAILSTSLQAIQLRLYPSGFVADVVAPDGQGVADLVFLKLQAGVHRALLCPEDGPENRDERKASLCCAEPLEAGLECPKLADFVAQEEYLRLADLVGAQTGESGDEELQLFGCQTVLRVVVVHHEIVLTVDRGLFTFLADYAFRCHNKPFCIGNQLGKIASTCMPGVCLFFDNSIRLRISFIFTCKWSVAYVFQCMLARALCAREFLCFKFRAQSARANEMYKNRLL